MTMTTTAPRHARPRVERIVDRKAARVRRVRAERIRQREDQREMFGARIFARTS